MREKYQRLMLLLGRQIVSKIEFVNLQNKFQFYFILRDLIRFLWEEFSFGSVIIVKPQII